MAYHGDFYTDPFCRCPLVMRGCILSLHLWDFLREKVQPERDTGYGGILHCPVYIPCTIGLTILWVP